MPFSSIRICVLDGLQLCAILISICYLTSLSIAFPRSRLIFNDALSCSALRYLKEAIDLQEEVSDTHLQLIHTHQDMAIALRGLGRNSEAEEEMTRAAECAKKLEKEEKEEENDWMDFS